MKWNFKNSANKSNSPEETKSGINKKSSDQASDKKKVSLAGAVKSNIHALRSRRFKAASYNTVLCVIALVIVIVVNLVVSNIPAKYTKFDVSEQKLYEISEQTQQILKDLKNDVTFYLVAEPAKENSIIAELLDRYAGMSSHVKVVHKDPVADPTFTDKYTKEDLDENSVIVVSDQRNQILKSTDIIVSTYEQNPYYGTQEESGRTFYGEQLFTSAINYVTSDKLPILYALTGHGETELSDTMKKNVSLENIELKSLSLTSMESVPKDADGLLICAPTSDLSKEDETKILTYLQNGGKLLLFTDYTATALANLKLLMQNYGVEAVDGVVIENNSNNYIPQSAQYYLLPNLESQTITDPLIKNKTYILMPVAHGIKKLDSYRDTLKIEPLLMTTDDSYAQVPKDNQVKEKQSGDAAGPFMLGAAITESFNEVTTKIVWFSSAGMLTDEVNQYVSGGNSDLVLNSLGWMSDREESISIRPKSLTQSYLTVPEGAGSTWSIFFWGIIPAAVLITGGVKWFIRRRKK